MRCSKPQTKYESILQHWLGYRFYLCQTCGWRGKGKPLKKSASTKMSVWKIIVMSVLVVLVVLFVAIEIFDVGVSADIATDSEKEN